jgi:hypothetical protein
MKFKISLLAFTFVISSGLFSQKNKNEKTIDSIIVEVTKNYANINSDESIQEESKKCYEELINNRDTNKTLLKKYAELLQKYNLQKIETDLFLDLIQIKQQNPKLNLGQFLMDLKKYSENFQLRYPKEKIFMTDSLFKKYKSRIPNDYEKPSETLPEKAENQILSVQNLLIFLFLISLIIILKLKRSINKNKVLLERLNKKFNKKTQQTSPSNVVEINSLKNQVKQLEKELLEMKSGIHESSNGLVNNRFDNSHQNDNVNDTITKSVSYPLTFYFRQPSIDGNFKNELKIDDFEASLSMFKFNLNSDITSTFEYCGDSNISKLISNNPNTHLGLVCDFVNTSDQYNSRIENIVVGKAELKNDLWIVTQKAKIKFS